MNPEIEDELRQLPTLRYLGAALFEYAQSLAPGANYVKEHRRWVLKESANTPSYVTITIQYARAHSIVVTLYGECHRFTEHRELELKPERSGYWSKFTVTETNQLAAAASYIKQAHSLSEAR